MWQQMSITTPYNWNRATPLHQHNHLFELQRIRTHLLHASNILTDISCCAVRRRQVSTEGCDIFARVWTLQAHDDITIMAWGCSSDIDNYQRRRSEIQSYNATSSLGLTMYVRYNDLRWKLCTNVGRCRVTLLQWLRDVAETRVESTGLVNYNGVIHVLH